MCSSDLVDSVSVYIFCRYTEVLRDIGLRAEALHERRNLVWRHSPESDVRVGDPTSIYMKKIRSMMLLTREGEVAIAQRIEQGELIVLNAILNSPIAVRVILELGDKLRAHTIRVKDIVRDAEEEDQGFDEQMVEQSVIHATASLAFSHGNTRRAEPEDISNSSS